MAVLTLEEKCIASFEESDYTQAVELLTEVKDPSKLQGQLKVSEGTLGLLHMAVKNGWVDVMKTLITKHNFEPSRGGCEIYTLHVAVMSNRIDVVKYLVEECGCDPKARDPKGKTSLHYIASNADYTQLVQYLVSEYRLDPNARDEYGRTPLHIASWYNHVGVVRYLVGECGCDPMAAKTDGKTSLHIAVSHECVDVVKYLVSEGGCDPMHPDNEGRSCLHIAVMKNFLSIVEYLLSTGKVDPQAKCFNNVTSIQLAQHKGKEVELLFNRFDKIKVSHPIDSYVNVLVLGNPGAGKSTLVKVIIDRAISTPAFGQFRTVENVEQYTAGIIPTKLQHKHLGNIILHDFAGQVEYYTSHTAVITNLLQGSPAVFIVVVNILEEKAIKHFQHWLTIITNEVHKALHQCHIIAVISHVDEMTDATIRRKRKSELKEIVTMKKKCGTHISFEFLDCRKYGGGNISAFLSNLSSTCQSIRNAGRRKLSLYCHMMYGLLEDSKQNVLTLSDVAVAVRMVKDRYFLPKSEKDILEVLSSLHSTGLISLLKSPDDTSKVWVVVNKQILLAEVDGILFAPRTFKQYRDIASNTGIITVSALTQLFPHYDPDMLICFFKNMALCQEIDPLHLAMTNLIAKGSHGDKKKLLFFPALLNIDRPDNINQQVFQFGWCLQCNEDNHFFPSHFFHILLLNLAYKYGLPDHTSTLNLQCTFWNNGIHWFNGDGIGTLVELVSESQCVLVLMSCEEGYEKNMVSLRKDVITEITTLQREHCPTFNLLELVLDPRELIYPIDKPMERTVYNVQDIITCIVKRKSFVNGLSHSGKSVRMHKELKKLLPNESLDVSDVSHLSVLGKRNLKELTDSVTLQLAQVRNLEPIIRKSSAILDITDLDDVIDVLVSSDFPQYRWDTLGIYLGLYDHTLKSIRSECKGFEDKCFQECIAAWLKKEDKVVNKGGPTWSSLATALEKMELQRITVDIRKKV